MIVYQCSLCLILYKKFIEVCHTRIYGILYMDPTKLFSAKTNKQTKNNVKLLIWDINLN